MNNICRDICTKIKEYARKAPFLVPYHQRVYENMSVCSLYSVSKVRRYKITSLRYPFMGFTSTIV